jgi:lysophospholipase L1-like esterase
VSLAVLLAIGAMADPCAQVAAAPPELVAYQAAQAKAATEGKPAPSAPPNLGAIYSAWGAKRREQDFADHCRYAAANAALPSATAKRVVFFGDSITEIWSRLDPALFEGDVVNRGISGQTTAQMIGRFQQDVIALKPAVVHIMAGTNDIAGNTGPTSLAWIEANVRAMAEMAKANHVRVVLSAVTPAARYTWRPEIDSVASIRDLNAWLAAYAKREGLGFVDYAPVLTDGHNGIKPELSADGVHPNAKAYELMRPLARRALAEALKGR